MAGMRVMQLAKELGTNTAALMKKIEELELDVKSHAAVLSPEQVKKIKDAYKTGTKAAGKKVVKKATSKAAELRAKRAEEIKASRAKSTSDEGDLLGANVVAKQVQDADEPKEDEATAKTEKKPAAKKKTTATKAAKKVEAYKEAKPAEKKAAAKKATSKKEAEPKEPAKKVITAGLDEQTKAGFDSLMSQIGQEADRLTKEGVNVAPAYKRSKKGRPGVHVEVPELDQPVVTKEDRYAAMAAAAEKLQRDKVLEEARAAVAAASHGDEGRRRRRKEKREAEAAKKAEEDAIKKGLDPTLVLDDSVAEIPEGASVAKFAECLNIAPNEVVKRLFLVGQPLTLTQTMSQELMELIADDLERKIRIVSEEEEFSVAINDSEKDLKPRPPVITVMGHVDHGKTSLLDAIRDTAVIDTESGGITQHIGASVVFKNNRQITFIDTPGHEAFTAMRARGAKITDVIVLVVAADDGVMPQTIEAINHAKAADVPVVVAVNKIDKDNAEPDRVMQMLTEHEIIPEEWGGKNMFVKISAKKRLHIDDLLDTILLQSDVLELKANPNAEASGYVIEANLDKGRGPVATLLVNRGTLWAGDIVVAGNAIGKARALIGPGNKAYKGVEPGEPVEILGLDQVPVAGDEFRVFKDEREARKLVESRRLRARIKEQQANAHMSLDDLFSKIESDGSTELNLIVKADVQGSIEALRDAFDKMDQSEVKINIVHSAVGGITETDVTLATASDAIIIGFNVRPTGKSRQMAQQEKVDIRTYKVIYQAIEDINAARIGKLSPDIVEKDTGTVEVRETFKVPKVGTIAGGYVVMGEINRNDKVRVVREGTVIYEGELASLKRFKDDVKSVKEGYECGLGIEGFQDIKVGDEIEGFSVVEVERTE